jgi:uncharacterized protein YjdB
MKRFFSIFALACMFGVASCDDKNDNEELKVELTDITVSPDAVSLVVNGTSQLTATAVPKDATGVMFTWSSDDASVAEVSSSGLVTAKSAGTANIKVTGVGGGITKFKTIPVTVAEEVIELQSISLSPATVVKPYGDTAHVTATLIPVNATGVTLNWESNNPSVATVSQEGVITITGVGTAKVTASFGAITSPEVDVTGTIRGLAIQVANGKPDGTYTHGDKVTLTAVIDPGNTGLQAEWSTSNPNVATYETAGDNTVEVTVGEEEGEATISATIGTFKADYHLTTTTPQEQNWEKENWEVINFSSQWVEGCEITNTIDGDPASRWHSDAGAPGLPQWFVIDLKKSFTISGILIWDTWPDAGSAPKNIVFEASENNTSWTPLLNVQEMNSAETSELDLPTSTPQKGRYLKVTINSTWGDLPWTHLSELSLY